MGKVRRRPGVIAPVAIPELSGVLLCGLRRALRGEPITKSARTRLEAMGLIERAGYDRFSRLTPKGLDLLQTNSLPSMTPTLIRLDM